MSAGHWEAVSCRVLCLTAPVSVSMGKLNTSSYLLWLAQIPTKSCMCLTEVNKWNVYPIFSCLAQLATLYFFPLLLKPPLIQTLTLGRWSLAPPPQYQLLPQQHLSLWTLCIGGRGHGASKTNTAHLYVKVEHYFFSGQHSIAFNMMQIFLYMFRIASCLGHLYCK